MLTHVAGGIKHLESFVMYVDEIQYCRRPFELLEARNRWIFVTVALKDST